MTRTFIHSFDPASASPVSSPTVDLEVSEIEDASIREVPQTPDAAYRDRSGHTLHLQGASGQAREVNPPPTSSRCSSNIRLDTNLNLIKLTPAGVRQPTLSNADDCVVIADHEKDFEDVSFECALGAHGH
ncbi:MAG TPA: hypothetical protein VGG79_05785 [Roseiarcus sp.]|jgi:hypothetical protein